jgi:hypothetical protein
MAKKSNISLVGKACQVTPIHYKLRKQVELRIGDAYHFSFGEGKVERGELIGVTGEPGDPFKLVELKCGRVVYRLYSDELGTTPEQAILNQVTL